MYARLCKTIGKEQSGSFHLARWYKDLSSDKSAEEIARSIIDLATSIKNEKHDVSKSNIIIRADDKN